MLVGIRRTSGLLCASSAAAKPGWFLWEVAIAVAASGTTTAVASAETIVGRVLLLSGGINVGWGLLANIHAKLLDVC